MYFKFPVIIIISCKLPINCSKLGSVPNASINIATLQMKNVKLRKVR